MHVKPIDGRLVRDYRTLRPLPAEGIEVPDHDPHWVRLLRDGDVVRTGPQFASELGARVEAPAAPGTAVALITDEEAR